MAQHKIVKLYGAPHSGAHYLGWLIHNNINNSLVLFSHTGNHHGTIPTEPDFDGENWVHYFIPEGDIESTHNAMFTENLNTGYPYDTHKNEIIKQYKSGGVLIICLFRNPYDWMYSSIIKHRLPEYNVEFLTKYWNELATSYFNYEWENKMLIAFETLRENPEMIINKIRNHFAMKNIRKFINTKRDVIKLSQQKPGNVGDTYEYGKSRCKEVCEDIYGTSPEEFDEIFNRNISKENLDRYNQLCIK